MVFHCIYAKAFPFPGPSTLMHHPQSICLYINIVNSLFLDQVFSGQQLNCAFDFCNVLKEIFKQTTLIPFHKQENVRVTHPGFQVSCGQSCSLLIPSCFLSVRTWVVSHLPNEIDLFLPLVSLFLRIHVYNWRKYVGQLSAYIKLFPVTLRPFKRNDRGGWLVGHKSTMKRAFHIDWQAYNAHPTPHEAGHIFREKE